MPRLLVAALVAVLALLVPPAASASPEGDPVVLTVYYGQGCPHCAAEREYLTTELAPKYPDLVVEEYEVWYDEANRERLLAAAQEYGFEPSGVPVTIVDGQVFIGFGAATGPQLEAAVAAALEDAEPVAPQPADEVPGTSSVTVPIVGTVDLANRSLLVSTLVIGFVDGINPCSLWVLSVLLAIVLHSGSRGRVMLVGTVFLTVTAAMYALYVVGLYTALDYLDGLTWIRVAVAAVAGVFGVLQLKDAVAPGRGPSLSIPEERRPGLYARMRSVATTERGVVATVAGTVVLAAGVSLLETPCTAGLPLLWTTLLTEQGVSTGTAVALFGVYMAVFLLDELVVFTVAVVTLRAAKIQERHGRVLKLVAGSVLVALAVAMLVAPEAMQSVTGSLAVFGAAGVLALLLWWLVPSAGDRQERRQRDSTVPSSARARADAAKPRGSASGPTAMRRDEPPTSTGTIVQHSSSTRRSATRSPSSDGPPSQSSRRRPRSAR